MGDDMGNGNMASNIRDKLMKMSNMVNDMENNGGGGGGFGRGGGGPPGGGGGMRAQNLLEMDLMAMRRHSIMILELVDKIV